MLTLFAIALMIVSHIRNAFFKGGFGNFIKVCPSFSITQKFMRYYVAFYWKFNTTAWLMDSQPTSNQSFQVMHKGFLGRGNGGGGGRQPDREERDQHFVARQRTRLLKKMINGQFQDRDFYKSRTRPGQDLESRAFSLDTERKTWWDLNKFSRFIIFCNKTRPKTS
jgi:hypothetical protein